MWFARFDLWFRFCAGSKMKINIFTVIVVLFISISANAEINIFVGGSASSSSDYSDSYSASKAIDGNLSTRWNNMINLNFPHWWRYDLSSAACVFKVQIKTFNYGGGTNMKDFIFQGSNDNFNTYVNLYTGQVSNQADGIVKEFTFNNNNSYLSYRLFISSTWAISNSVSFYEIYAYENDITSGMGIDNYIFLVGLLGAVSGLVFCMGVKIA